MRGWAGTLHTRVHSIYLKRCEMLLPHLILQRPLPSQVLQPLRNASFGIGKHSWRTCSLPFPIHSVLGGLWHCSIDHRVDENQNSLALCLPFLICFQTASTIQKQKPSQTSSSKGKLRKVSRTMNTVTPLVGAHKILFASAFAAELWSYLPLIRFWCFAPLSRL